MQFKVGPSFTGTAGAGHKIKRHFVFDFDIKKCPYLDKESVTSFDTFKQGEIKNKKQQVIERLDLFSEHLTEIYQQKIDPIKYLIFLYYKEELSINEIYKRHFNFGYSSSNSLWYMLSKSLNWNLRDNHELNERRLRQKKSKNSKTVRKLKENAQELKDLNIQKCLEILDTYNLTKDKENFSKEVFNGFEGKGSKGKKIWYILQFLHGITPETILKLNTVHGIGARTIARVINTKIQTSCALYGIEYIQLELQSGYISNILQKEKNKNTR